MEFFRDSATVTLIYLLTLLVIIWYTWETRRMRKIALQQVGIANQQAREMIRQTRLNIMPAFIAELRASGSTRFYLKNIGNGTALNIQVLPLVNPISSIIPVTAPKPPIHSYEGMRIVFDKTVALEEQNYEGLSINFETMPLLPAKDEILVENKSCRKKSLADEETVEESDEDIFHLIKLIPLYYPQVKNLSYELTIQFQDIGANRYIQILRIDGNKCIPGPVEPLQN